MANTGYYEIYRQQSQWRWRFKANNHEIIAHGESYWNKSDCLNAVNLLKGSYNSPVYET